jgi:3-oxoacyl-(acyl-carrier-protein) synthase
MNSVVLSSWGMIYHHLSDEQIVHAAFHDEDLFFQKGSKICPNPLTPRENKMIALHALLGILAVEEAWTKACLGEQRNLLFGRGPRFRQARAAVVAGTNMGSLGHIPFDKTPDLYSSSKFRHNALAAPIAIRFGLGGGDFSLCASSATGGEAIWLAANLIQMNLIDVAVVVCSELTNDFSNELAKSMGVKSASGTERPLSAQRDGMRIVESAVALILESEEHAKQRNFQPMARWLSGSVKNECYQLLAPDESMNALEEAFLDTLKAIGLESSQIDWISLHATGTKIWDPLEIGLFKKLFPKIMPHLSAFKRTFGHGRSTACLMASAMIAEGLKNNQTPVLPADIDPLFKLDLSLIQHKSPKLAMHWSAGMGGTMVVNLFQSLTD